MWPVFNWFSQMAAVLLLSICISSTFANTMDAIEKHEVRQAACKSACAKWSTMASLWTDGEILKDADSHCAELHEKPHAAAHVSKSASPMIQDALSQLPDISVIMYLSRALNFGS